MKTYTARVSRDEGWWIVEVEEVAGLFTQARRLEDIPAQLRDALELFPELEDSPQTAQIIIKTETN